VERKHEEDKHQVHEQWNDTSCKDIPPTTTSSVGTMIHSLAMLFSTLMMETHIDHPIRINATIRLVWNTSDSIIYHAIFPSIIIKTRSHTFLDGERVS
jgi:hypothetical protein